MLSIQKKKKKQKKRIGIGRKRKRRKRLKAENMNKSMGDKLLNTDYREVGGCSQLTETPHLDAWFTPCDISTQ